MTEKLKRLVLRPGRDKSVRLKHPWIFASAINSVDGTPENGETVNIVSSNDEFLGTAAFSGFSQIRARMWSWDPAEKIDGQFLHTRISQAIEKRKKFVISNESDSYRLIFGESDGLPGLIVDQYNEILVIQILSAGIELLRDQIFEILRTLIPGKTLFERSDVDVRALEGLQPRIGLISGKQLPNKYAIHEYGIEYLLNIEKGQKTGFYLDQRQNRYKLRQFCQNKDVLNCFSYTGGFTLNALKGEADSVLSIDSSQSALDQMTININKNGLNFAKSESLCGDVFVELRKLRDKAASYDVIVLDPPKFAPTVAQAEKAARGYKDINLLAFKLLRPGGILFTFSCSGGISRDLFQKIVAGAASDAGCDAQIINYLSQDSDHPVSLHFPESLYLKGLICIK